MHVEEIADLLLLLPTIVRKQESRSADFSASAKAWLASLEKVLTASRLYQAGSIAALRSGLVAVEQGQIPGGLEFRSRPSRSRVLNTIASQTLYRAAEVATNLMAENRPRIAEAERVARQIIAAALSRRLVTVRDTSVSNTQYLRHFRRSLDSNADLESASVHLEGLVGPHDALVLFDRSLALYQDEAVALIRPWTLPSSG